MKKLNCTQQEFDELWAKLSANIHDNDYLRGIFDNWLKLECIRDENNKPKDWFVLKHWGTTRNIFILDEKDDVSDLQGKFHTDSEYNIEMLLALLPQ